MLRVQEQEHYAMEVRESTACGVADREFNVTMDEREAVKIYRFLKEARKKNVDGSDPELIEELIDEIARKVGPTVDM
jgi:hypothetical protein